MKVNFVKEFEQKLKGGGVNILMAIDKKNNHQGVLFMAKVYHNIIIALYDLICVVLGISVRLNREEI